jgi:hypothetical protein
LLNWTVMKSLLPILGVVALSSSLAHADAREDFAFALKEHTGDYHRAWIITKLTTIKVGPQCWEKIVDAGKYSAVNKAAFYTRDVAEYAKTVTGDDWSRIETQNNSDRETNKATLEPMLDAFKAKFSLTISVEGKDCSADSDALWLRYWVTLGTALKDYPPKGKVSIKLDVTTKAKDVTATVDKTGSKFVITAPRDVEAAAWDTKIEAPFKKLAKKL